METLIEKPKSYNRMYYEKNRDKYSVNGKYNEKIMCKTCNREYSKLNFSTHLKSQKHQNLDKKEDNKFTAENIEQIMRKIINENINSIKG
jgi:hypothetical protein